MGPTGPGAGTDEGHITGYLGKPGLTSLADLNARTVMDPAEQEKYDVYYAKNQSLALDLEILMRSLRR